METLSADRPICEQPRQAARCPGSAGKQTGFSSAGNVAHGFLSHRFLPLCEPSAILPEAKNVEGGFFKSLGHLAELMAHFDAGRKIKVGGRYRDVMIMEQDESRVELIVSETLNIGNTIFYIPVIPLYHWHSKRKNRKTAELLLSVCTYLFQAGVPYYRDEESYLFYNYEILTDWIEDDRAQMDEDDYRGHRNGLNRATHFGDLMERRIKSPLQLSQMRDRLQNFVVRTAFDLNVLELAETTFNLWQRFPEKGLFSNACIPDADPGEDEYDDHYSVLHLGEYVGFIAEQTGILNESLMNMVNNDFNEKTRVQEPECRINFGKKGTYRPEALDYEHQLFDIISELTCLLNELP
jgi:hypothetical protein